MRIFTAINMPFYTQKIRLWSLVCNMYVMTNAHFIPTCLNCPSLKNNCKSKSQKILMPGPMLQKCLFYLNAIHPPQSLYIDKKWALRRIFWHVYMYEDACIFYKRCASLFSSGGSFVQKTGSPCDGVYGGGKPRIYN